MNSATTNESIGYFQKYNELVKDIVRYCPYDGDKLKVVSVADGDAIKKCRFCGWSI